MKRVSFGPNVVFVSACFLALAILLSEVSSVARDWLELLVSLTLYGLGEDYYWTVYPAWILTGTLLFALPGYVLLVIGKGRFPHWVTSILVVAWFGVWLYWYFSWQPDMT